MTARILHLGLYHAIREVEAGIAEVREANNRVIAFLKADADRRRGLIEQHLRRIENDVEHLRPSDVEAG